MEKAVLVRRTVVGAGITMVARDMDIVQAPGMEGITVDMVIMGIVDTVRLMVMAGTAEAAATTVGATCTEAGAAKQATHAKCEIRKTRVLSKRSKNLVEARQVLSERRRQKM